MWGVQYHQSSKGFWVGGNDWWNCERLIVTKAVHTVLKDLLICLSRSASKADDMHVTAHY